jgi:DNA invertase Pin-like site-specific DNA recombinase
MESVVPTLYLYSRVSSEKQTEENKYGLQRQQESQKVDNTVDKFSTYPVIQFSDPGLSAFKKEHINKGQLGKFVELVNKGRIAIGSILAMEKIDRFSRLGLTEAQNIATQLLHFGIKIYTWEDKELYSRDDLPQAIKMALKLEGASEYSKNISINVKGSALARIKDFNDGRCDAEGHKVAVNGIGSHVWWIDASSGYIKKHDYYWPIAREIVGWILNGLGHQKIGEKLHQAGYIPPRKKDEWGDNLIIRFHMDDKILGTREINIDGNKYVLRDYYPKLVSLIEYEQILEIKKQNRSGRNGIKKDAGLFVGFKKLRCARCGRTINTFKGKSGQKNEVQRYRCAGKYDKKKKCKVSSTVDGKYFESALIKLVGTVVAAPPEKDFSYQILDLEARLKSVEQDMKDYDLLLLRANSATRFQIMDRLNLFGEEQLKLTKEIEELRTVPVTDPLAINKIPTDIINYRKTEERVMWRTNFYSHIKRVLVKLSRNYTDFYIELYNGNKIHAGLLNNKYIIHYNSEHFNSFHETEEQGGVIAYNATNDWVGTDRKGNKIEIKNADDYFLTDGKKITAGITKITKRVEDGEDIFINIPLLSRL